MSAQLGPQPHEPLLVKAEAGESHRLGGAFGVADDAVEMVDHPLQLGVHHPKQPGLLGHLGAGEGFDGLAERQGVRHAGYPFHPLGQQHPVGGIEPDEAGLDAAMLVVYPGAQVGDVLAWGFHEVLHRLEHPGADRAQRDGEDPLAAD